MSDSHWIKPAGSTYAPGCIIVVTLELDTIDRSTSTGHFVSTCKRIHVAESHRRSFLWSSPLYLSFDKLSDLYDWMESTRTTRRRTYVFTDNVFDTMTLTEFWERIELRGCKQTEGTPYDDPTVGDCTPSDANRQPDPPMKSGDSACVDGTYYFNAFIPGVNANIVRYRTLDRSFQWCNHSQYCQSSIDDIARHIHYKWTTEQDDINQRPNQHHSDAERTLMMLRFYQQLCDWWIDVDGGPWGPTVAAMSYSFLRRRLQPKTVLRHDNDTVGEIEEKAIFAGRRAVWYFGNIGRTDKWLHYGNAAPNRSTHGTIDRDMVQHDVRSMYPYLLSCMEYPVRLLYHHRDISPEKAIDIMQNDGLIATVTIQSNSGEYPYRFNGRIHYPTGRFVTTLCGAELMYALSSGEVVRVGEAASYAMGSPFKETCSELLAMRQSARDNRETMWELFIKMLSNSMSGKIAQMPYQWRACKDKVAKYSWGGYTENNTLLDSSDEWSGDIEVYKAWAGMVWQRVLSESKIRPMGAAYAYLTSYGRFYMRWLRSICPAESVIAQDTDGIWTTAEAALSLYADGVIDRSRGGDINWKRLCPVGRFYGPQHYWYGAGWIMSGSNVYSHRPKSDSIVVRERQTVLATARDRPQPVMYERLIERQIGRIQASGVISPFGWIVPPHEWCDLDLG